MALFDINATGQMLVGPMVMKRDMIVLAPGAEAEIDFSWLDWSTPWMISADGSQVLFEEGNDVSRPDGYAVYLRGTDGSPPLRLGYGAGLALSPDGRWVAMLRGLFVGEQELALVPTGPGATVFLDLGTLEATHGGGMWVGGGPKDEKPGLLLLLGRQRETESALGIYRLPVAPGHTPEPVTPRGLALAPRGHVVSDDGRRLVVSPSEGPAVEFTLTADGTTDGAPRPVPGLEPSDLPLRFDRDGRHLYVQSEFEVPARIVRIDTRTGERTPWRELRPLDPAGVFVVDRLHVSSDGSAYVYSTRRVLSVLSSVEGLE
jgi:hypothetical protein